MYMQTENLSYTYMPGTPFAGEALRGVSLSLERGGFTLLTGPSGSGKTTLVQILSGLLRPTGGRVLVDGCPVDNSVRGWAVLRRRAGLVFQSPEQQFFAETVFDEVAFAPRNRGLPEEEVAVRVERALSLVGLDPRETAPLSPFSLSAGRQRLAAIASVLSLEPELLILDEPVAGLDPSGRRRLFTLLERLKRDAGLTVLVVAHRLEEAASLADHILVLEAGSLAAAGTPSEILKDPDRAARLDLELPAAAVLLHGLAARGWPVRADLFTMEEVSREIFTAARRTGFPLTAPGPAPGGDGAGAGVPFSAKPEAGTGEGGNK